MLFLSREMGPPLMYVICPDGPVAFVLTTHLFLLHTPSTNANQISGFDSLLLLLAEPLSYLEGGN